MAKLVKKILMPFWNALHNNPDPDYYPCYKDEKVLTDGKVDITKLKPLIFDIDRHGYYSVGEKKADAFSVGAKLKKYL